MGFTKLGWSVIIVWLAVGGGAWFAEPIDVFTVWAVATTVIVCCGVGAMFFAHVFPK